MRPSLLKIHPCKPYRIPTNPREPVLLAQAKDREAEQEGETPFLANNPYSDLF